MTREEQIKFVHSHIWTIAERAEEMSDKLPENWEGTELKQWIGDMFTPPKQWLKGKRRTAYNNDILVNNLT